jgi:two-component system nitrogen regulation response regulator GlnG
MPTLLAIDDEPAILKCLQLAFSEPEMLVVTATTGAEGIAQAQRHRPDVVILDIDLPDQSGLEVFRQIHDLDPKVPIIFVTGHGTTTTAIRAMTLGAYEYLLKPLRLDHLRELLKRALEVSRLMRVPAVVSAPADEGTSDVLVGHSAVMQEVYKAIGRVAPQDVTVLVLGESGTGKELVARAIYHYSRRSEGPFLAINCAAIPEPLLENELFGHEKGAFTGADRRRVGKFEQCSGGTLILDEVGDMAALTQTKLLRVLQEQRFERVGGNETIQTDVRLIAATNRDLDRLVAAGRFRSDLYYRLNVFTIRLPPLRERTEDLPVLVDHFLKRFRRELGKDVRTVVPEVIDLLRCYQWPGNLRELQSNLKQALLQTSGPLLRAESLPPSIRSAAQRRVSARASLRSTLPDVEQFVRERIQADSQDVYREWLALTDRHLLIHVLQHTRGNLSQAARVLGITRPTLRNRMRELGLRPKEFASGEEEHEGGT